MTTSCACSGAYRAQGLTGPGHGTDRDGPLGRTPKRAVMPGQSSPEIRCVLPQYAGRTIFSAAKRNRATASKGVRRRLSVTI